MLIGGVDIGRTTSCVGEVVTYVCTVDSPAHLWSSADFAQSVTIAGGSPDVTDENGFTFLRMSFADGILTSSVTLTSYSGLDGVMIACVDATAIDAEEQNTIAMVYGELIKSECI